MKHEWDWKLHRDKTPHYAFCVKCGAERHWNKKQHRWGAAMYKGFRQPFCEEPIPEKLRN